MWPGGARGLRRDPAGDCQSSAAVSSSAAMRPVVSTSPFCSEQALRASPSAPIVSACRIQRNGIAIERYVWIRASCSGWSSESPPSGLGRLGKRLAVGEPVRVAGEHAAKLLLGEPGAVRRAERDEERARLLPVGEVGGVDDLLRRDAAVEVEQVDRAPGRGVEEDVLAARHRRREVRQVGDSRVGDDQRGVGALARRASRGRPRSGAGRGRRGSGSARAAPRPARTPARAGRRPSRSAAPADGA